MVLRIWSGALSRFFRKLYCNMKCSTIITQLHTAHSVINYFTINNQVSGDRIKYFGILTLGWEFLCQCSRLTLVDLDSFTFCALICFPL